MRECAGESVRECAGEFVRECAGEFVRECAGEFVRECAGEGGEGDLILAPFPAREGKPSPHRARV